MLWMILAAFFWLNSIFIGAWYNVTAILHLPLGEASVEMMKVIAVAPLAGIMESSAAFWAILQWSRGHRTVNWQPTPKTTAADKAALMKGDRQ